MPFPPSMTPARERADRAAPPPGPVEKPISGTGTGTETHATPRMETVRVLPPADYWTERFEGYMPPELRARYLATPPAERFLAFGEKLLDYERREAALERFRSRLAPEDVAAYRALPDARASNAFLKSRFPREMEIE